MGNARKDTQCAMEQKGNIFDFFWYFVSFPWFSPIRSQKIQKRFPYTRCTKKDFTFIAHSAVFLLPVPPPILCLEFSANSFFNGGKS